MRLVLVFIIAIVSFAKLSGQVNLQTGSAVYGIPVYDFKEEKSRLTESIGLAYHSGNGLKLDEAASSIGQGWNLMAGGVISRMQVGEPDDQHAVDYVDQSSQKLIRYPDGFLYNQNTASNGCPAAKVYYPLFSDPNVVYKQGNLATGDTEQDYFSFVFNGRTNIFVLDKSHPHTGQVLGDSKLIISFAEADMTTQGIRTTISSFTIEDEQGLVYRFNDRGQTKLLTNYFAVGNFFAQSYTKINSAPQPANQGVYQQGTFDELLPVENPYIISSWYLSEIEDKFTHRKILFNYSDENTDNFAGQTICLTEAGFPQPTPEIPNPPKQYINVFNHRSIVKNRVLTKIIYPDGTEAIFLYATDQRLDFHGSHALQFIDLRYNAKLITRYELTQQYFGDAVYNTTPRLYLTGCTQYNSDLTDRKVSGFNYFMSAGTGTSDDFIPPVYFECRDAYGYYNGSNSGISNPANIFSFTDYSKLCHFRTGVAGTDSRPPKPGYAKIGLLRSITTPAGSTISYDYNQIVGYGGVQVFSYAIDDGTNPAAKQTTEYSYILANGQSSIWGTEVIENSLGYQTDYIPETKTFNGVSCNYRYKYPGIQSIDESVNITALQQFFGVFSQIVGYVGLGLDIYGIIAAVGSTGQLEVAIIMFLFDVLSNILFTCTSDASDNEFYDIFYSVNLKMGNPLPLQFKRVEVRQTSQGASIGKTVFEFTNPDDFPDGILVNNFVFPYSFKPRSINWAFGLPKLITVFDSDNKIISQTENSYNFSKAKAPLPDQAFQSCKCGVKFLHSKNHVDWQQPQFGNQFITASNNDLAVDNYSLYSGRVELTETDQRMFAGASSQLKNEIKTVFEYNPANFQVRKIITGQSNGDKLIKEIYYPSDYTSADILQTLVSNNALNLPVATYSSVEKSNTTTPSYLNANVPDFVTLANGDIKAYHNMTGRSQSPVAFSFDASNRFNYPGLVETNSSSFTANGNVSGAKDEGGRSTSFLYDYNDNRITATVKNADAVLDKIAYTSFETDNLGGWSLSGTRNDATTPAVTGSKCISLSNGQTLTASISATKSYILSFWATGTLSVNAGAVLTKSGPSINGNTYYEYSIPEGQSSVTLQGNANLDEVRAYPATARMKTSTYNDLLLKTSDCDENNRITYFEYDGWGQLILIKDEKRNVIKMYEYNLKK